MFLCILFYFISPETCVRSLIHMSLISYPHYIKREWFFDGIADIKLLRKICVSDHFLLGCTATAFLAGSLLCLVPPIWFLGRVFVWNCD
jgi:hypothetical protein